MSLIQYFFRLLVLLTLTFSTSILQAREVDMLNLSAHSLSDWQTLAVPENTLSFLMELKGNGNTTYQIADLIAPDGTRYVESRLKENPFTTPLTGYEHPYSKTMMSKNKSVGVIQNYGALLVPNFYTTELLPSGQWRYRVFGMNRSENHTIDVNVIFKSPSQAVQRTIRIRLLVERDSFWDLNPEYLTETLRIARQTYREHNIHLNISTESFYPLTFPHGEAPNAISQIVTDLRFNETMRDGTVMFLLLSRMSNNTKPINGLACLAGFYSQSGCFASMFADPITANTITPFQAGKIFAHELGHYLGLFHTRDDDYPFAGTLFDPLEDTSEEVLGTNIMDPGIHNEHPEFSPQQIHVLKLHPAVRER